MFAARVRNICARWGITVEKYHTLSAGEKVEYRNKFPSGRTRAPNKRAPVIVAPLTPEEERTKSMELTMLATRADVTVEDFQAWQKALPSWWYNPSREAGRTAGRVNWTNGELDVIAGHSAHYLLRNGIFILPEKHDRVGLGFLIPAVQDAVKHLPKERRKLVEFRAQVSPKLQKALKIALKAGGKKMQAQAPALPQNAPESKPVAPAVTASAGTNGHDHKVITMPGLPPQPKDEQHEIRPYATELEHATNEQLLSVLLARLFRSLEKKDDGHRVAELERIVKDQQAYQELLTSEMADMRNDLRQLQPQLTMAPIEEHSIAQVALDTKKAPRVAVVGGREDTFNFIVQGAEEAGMKLDFRYYDMYQKPHDFRADYCLQLRWAGHDWDKKVKDAIPSGRREFVRGGISQALTQLLLWFPQHAQAQG